MRSAHLFFAVIALGAASTIAAEPEPESVTIPLDQIWGFDLPGTQDIAGMPLPEIAKEGPGVNYASLRRKRELCIETFRRALTAKPSTEPAQFGMIIPSPPDFRILDRVGFSVAPAVGGNPKFQAMTRNSFQVGSEMTLVFFTHPAAYYVRLRSVVREGNEIIVTYQFEPHATVESTVHFALIPLGTLPVGEYWVKFKQQEMERKYFDAGFLRVPSPAQTIVSQQFKFTVWEPPVADKPDPTAQTIPLETVWADDIEGTRDVRKLEGKPSGDTTEKHIASSRVLQLEQALRATNDPAGPGFVVPAVDAAALEQACDVIAKGGAPTNVVPPDVDATLVFFANSWLPLHLDRIERDGHAIKIKYHFVQTGARASQSHFALIPVGKLPSGKYDVAMVRLPTEGQGGEVDPERVNRIVCQDFSFDVAQRLEKR